MIPWNIVTECHLPGVPDKEGIMCSGNREIISQALRCAPEVAIQSAEAGWTLCRWRTFIGDYHLAGLPDPMMSIHISGQRRVRTWQENSWSRDFSTPGDISMINTRMPSKWLIEGELDVITISIDRKFFDTDALNQSFNYKNMKFAFTDELYTAISREIMKNIVNKKLNNIEYIYSMISTMKLYIINNIVRLVNSNNDKDSLEHKFDIILKNIKQNPMKYDSLEDIISDAHVSRTYLISKFNKLFHSTPYQYILNSRFEMSRDLLESSNKLIYEIAHAVGFDNHEHFSRSFKRRYGLSPSDYRYHSKPESRN